VSLEIKPDPKGNKDTAHSLSLPSGYVSSIQSYKYF
jgi:hypothetical protein